MRNNLSIHSPKKSNHPSIQVPFMRPQIGECEVNEVIDTLRSGWLTTGPKVRKFEEQFAESVRGKFAVALNSCTAALHLAVEALGLREGQAVLVPTMTFAATAEILLYKKAIPILVDCDPVTGNLDLADAEQKIKDLRLGRLPIENGAAVKVVGIIPVHVGGYLMNMREVKKFADKYGIWVVEDAAHAFPAAWRETPDSEWQFCGEDTATVSCYSFYANKTITTGEGGMAVTNNQVLAERIRLMSLHGLSHDAWGRYGVKGSWDYKIMLPGYKYNLTDIAAAIGLHQLERSEEMRRDREDVARFYIDELMDTSELELPIWDENRIHSWHLFPVRLNLDSLGLSRNEFIEDLKAAGVGCSVHWRPLHMHPLYKEKFGWQEKDFPEATKLWERIVSLPIFPAMTQQEVSYVVETVKQICSANAVSKIAMVA